MRVMQRVGSTLAFFRQKVYSSIRRIGTVSLRVRMATVVRCLPTLTPTTHLALHRDRVFSAASSQGRRLSLHGRSYRHSMRLLHVATMLVSGWGRSLMCA